ncbi:MAG: hypothetical protein AAF570_05220, partial [Bacteroidota bacterium]
MYRNASIFRSLAAFVAVSLLFQTLLPWSFSLGKAQSGSGGQTDFVGFTAPGTSGARVDPATGEFRFSLPVITVPGAQGEGYALTLDYNGPSPESEASWVGYGWSLSPGAIVRQQEGLPDDFRNRDILSVDKRPDHQMIALQGSAGVEFFSKSADIKAKLGAIWDSEIGTYTTYGLGAAAGYKGTRLGLQYKGSQKGYAWSAYSKLSLKTFGLEQPGESADFSEKFLYKVGQRMASSAAGSLVNLGTAYAVNAQVSKKLHLPSHPGNWTKGVFSISAQGNPSSLPVGLEGGLSGNWQRTIYTPVRTLKSYGYLFSADGAEVEEALMDIREDNLHAIDKEDRYLPVPVATPDRFMVSAQGISGVFRAYHSSVGHFHHPANTESGKYSKLSNYISSLEVGLGANISVGGSVVEKNNSEDKVESLPWPITVTPESSDPMLQFEKAADKDEALYFAFENDPALFDAHDEVAGVVSANLGDRHGAMPASKTRNPQMLQPLEARANAGQRIARSTLIRTNTVNDCQRRTAHATPIRHHRRMLQDGDNLAHLNHSQLQVAGLGNELAEVEILSGDGSKYQFGLPVYVRNQVDLSFSLRHNEPSVGDISAADVVDHKRVFHPVPDLGPLLATGDSSAFDPYQYVRGKVIKDPYASMFLLTSIVSPDYVDLQADGPTADDLGSYVRFTYDQVHGDPDKTAGDWYKFRSPYHGMHYHEGGVGDARDDMGAFTAGEKEIYYLDEVETKTHIAEFVTQNREDGLGLIDFHTAANATNPATVHSTDSLKYLDRIHLYKKNDDGTRGKLLKTVRFEYAYEAWNNVPDHATGQGRLTLKKIWTESNGVIESAIHPYEFKYEYNHLNVSSYPELPSAYDDFFTEYPTTLDETPTYHPNVSNRWGVRKAGTSKIADRHLGWDTQIIDEAGYDPAAWHLKQVITPSGSTIMPQYEQGDYRHVQNQIAAVMTPVAKVTDKKIELDLAAIGITDVALRQEEIVAYLNDYFDLKMQVVAGDTSFQYDEMAYFKFLYTLQGTHTPQITGDCSNA